MDCSEVDVFKLMPDLLQRLTGLLVVVVVDGHRHSGCICLVGRHCEVALDGDLMR